MLYDLYRYDTWHDLLFDNGSITTANNLTDNRNMNNKLVKLHKGVDNLIRFRVFNSDRKKAKIDHLVVKGTFINKENRERVLTVHGDMDCARGLFNITVPEGDLVNIAAGFYDLVITGEENFIPGQTGEMVATPFFTDNISNVHLEAEITDRVEKDPLPTIEITDWTLTSATVEDVRTHMYYSQPVEASRLKNVKNGTHTMTVKANAFRGKLYVCGSLDHIPPSASDFERYFKMNVTDTEDEIQFGIIDQAGFIQPFSGMDAWTFQSNVMWMIFYWVATDNKGIPLPSSIDTPSKLTLDDLSVVDNWLDRVQLRS